MISLTQYPVPGTHLLRFCGDTLEVILRGTQPIEGRAVISTNIGNMMIHRMEVIQQAEDRITAGAQDWTNLSMERVDAFTFKIRLALCEEGHFEFKCCVIPENHVTPVWVQGDNVHLNVEPAAYFCSNTVYCAFVRQFGTNKNLQKSSLPESVVPSDIEKLDKRDYAVIPPSGTFRGLIRELDHIVNRLKCRIIHLLPINPTPTTYARMGRYGSPYASQDFTAIDPALAEFDTKASPLDQFYELVDAVHGRDAKLFLDIAINHTGWASKLQEEHPEWFVREQNGAYHSPGAWGVVWGDLIELDHNQFPLWKYIANVFLTWCKRGVDGFRCDAGYMIPAPAWEYIISVVRQEYPETIFLLEGLGGSPEVTLNLLNAVNMNWAYSELFQNYSRQQIEGYLKYAWHVSSSDGILIHYAETHDNSRLAAVSQRYSRMRTALSALTSSSGAFGFTNGVEWYASEKIDVHEASGLNWGAKENQIDMIARLNVILGIHPSFHAGAIQSFINSGTNGAVMFSRVSESGNEAVLAAVNLDCERAVTLTWDSSYAPFDQEEAYDLISGRKFSIFVQPHHRRSITLSPGQFICLTADSKWVASVKEAERCGELIPERLADQEASVMVLRMLCCKKQSQVLTSENIPELTALIRRSPEKFLEKIYEYARETPYVQWHWPEDIRRTVMIPPSHALLVTADQRFRFAVSDGTRIIYQVNSLSDSSGRYFAIVPPIPVPDEMKYLKAMINIKSGKNFERKISSLLLLPEDVTDAVVFFNREQIYNHSRICLQSNGKGAIMHQCMELERMDSRYDAILLANLSPDYPEDRHIMWRRIRLWITYHARLQELKHEHIESFCIAQDGVGVWRYKVPVGNGRFVELVIRMELVSGRNAVVVTFHRNRCPLSKERLSDEEPVLLMISPDLEDRNFHNETKAALGPEKYWPGKITEIARGFEFAPAENRKLSLQCSKGKFIRSDKWKYMVWQQNEATRGLDPNSDLYSPGYFALQLSGNESAYLAGQVLVSADEKRIAPVPVHKEESFEPRQSAIREVILDSLRQFVVSRGNLSTVIAGYPWFLDWGRDTLIAVRGLMVDPASRDEVRKILLQFASLEKAGTICNMISGSDTGNRDTSDAPLWLVIAVRDFCEHEGTADFLKTVVRGKETLLDVLLSLVRGYIKGTPNGIKCDMSSGLVFSPSHFTWMDTNYPAGTPREGYPVEIQAMWIAGLRFLSKMSTDPSVAAEMTALADLAQESFMTYFVLKDHGYLSDCLHASAGIPAAKAVADDHLRPNQLLAITLGIIQDKTLAKSILTNCSSLLIPGAIRSLADRPVNYPLPIVGRNGQLLNDPLKPYWGRYEGDEDTRRKPAYHNGTAWTWQFPLYCEAYFQVYGMIGKRTATALLSSMSIQMDAGCITHVPEILDGDYPHTSRGCDAQAWGMSEYFRVWNILHGKEK